MPGRSDPRSAWNANAPFWDERMGEGNDFVELLIWPAVERMLELRPGQRILDVACGNGLTSRRMAAVGADVVAIDVAEEMIDRARRRTPAGAPGADRIRYAVVDAGDREALLGLGEARFDAALCSMALFDMAEIEPLLEALPRLLRDRGRFVFSITHPCFNSPHVVHVAEERERDGELVATRAVKVEAYLTPSRTRSLAIRGQPVPHPYFHRPLGLLLGSAFRAGFVLDALEERAFPPGHARAGQLGWADLTEIPPVLVARLALA